MSHDPAETDESEPTSEAKDIRYDEWPLEGHDDPEQQPTYLGIMNPGDEEQERAVFYDDRKEAIFEADIEENEQRYVPREDTERELEPTDTLGEALEDLGDSLEWDSLSEFAREQLQSDDAASADAEPAGKDPGLGSVTFTRSNVGADADHDLEFSGSYERRTDDGREITVERTFEVTLDDPDAPRVATVDVTDHVLRTDEAAGDPKPDGTDADRLEERETTFEIDLGEAVGERQLESRIEERCEEWHTAHLEPPL